MVAGTDSRLNIQYEPPLVADVAFDDQDNLVPSLCPLPSQEISFLPLSSEQLITIPASDSLETAVFAVSTTSSVSLTTSVAATFVAEAVRLESVGSELDELPPPHALTKIKENKNIKRKCGNCFTSEMYGRDTEL